MSTRRRAYGTRNEPVKVSLLVERSSSDRLAEMARTAGVSKAVMFEYVLDSVEVTEEGLPLGWSADEEELPLRYTG